MNKALYILGGLLVIDIMAYLYFNVFRADYYFPDRYEEAFAATAIMLLLGLPVFGAFIALLAVKFFGKRV